MMNLTLTKAKVISGITRNISFRLVEVSDAETILELRLNPLRNSHISPIRDDADAQRKWIETYKTREQAGQEFYFVIVDNVQGDLGLVRLYDFEKDSFCWGSWVLRPKAPLFAAVESALMVYEVAFYSLGFSFARFDVRKENVQVLRFHKTFGAVLVREDDLNCYFRLEKETYEKTKPRYARFFSERKEGPP